MKITWIVGRTSLSRRRSSEAKKLLMRRRRLVVGLLIIIGAARFAQPHFRFSTTSMSRRTLMRVEDDIRAIRGSNV